MNPLEALGSILEEGWLVGGAVRDRLLGRSVTDLDVVLDGDASGAARSLAEALDAHRFPLSEGFGAWRLVARDHGWQVDLMPMLGETIEEDLSRRDLTINAIASPLQGGELLDPFAGTDDLAAGRLRMVSSQSFSDDPVRVMRLVRHACEQLDFEVERWTLEAARQAAPRLAEVAVERVFAELKRIIACDRALDGLELMESCGAAAAVLPELIALRGVEQSHYHHLDVHDHVMLVLASAIDLQRDPAALFGAADAAAITALLAEPLADGLTRGDGLRFGALLHDIAKPQTRDVLDSGRVTFMRHDSEGAVLAQTIFARLRASERLARHVAALTLHHLRLGFLVHRMPLERRVIYDYMRACEPVEVDVSLLSIADRLATRGKGADLAIEKHLVLARLLVGEGLRWRASPPQPPVRGDRLAKAIGLRPGPRLGELLRELEQASFAGEVSDAEGAVALARELLARER